MRVIPQEKNDFIIVAGLDDSSDGNAYVIDTDLVRLEDCFLVSLKMLTKHDQVCIVDPDDYNKLSHDFLALAPHSINISMGEYAWANKRNVNKL